MRLRYRGATTEGKREDRMMREKRVVEIVLRRKMNRKEDKQTC